MVDVSDDWDMAAARAKFAAKVVPGKAARKGRQKHLNGSVDGRSLRATGRTEHLNFRASPQIVEALDKHITKGKRSLWLEEAIIAKLHQEGVQFENA